MSPCKNDLARHTELCPKTLPKVAVWQPQSCCWIFPWAISARSPDGRVTSLHGVSPRQPDEGLGLHFSFTQSCCKHAVCRRDRNGGCAWALRPGWQILQGFNKCLCMPPSWEKRWLRLFGTFVMQLTLSQIVCHFAQRPVPMESSQLRVQDYFGSSATALHLLPPPDSQPYFTPNWNFLRVLHWTGLIPRLSSHSRQHSTWSFWVQVTCFRGLDGAVCLWAPHQAQLQLWTHSRCFSFEFIIASLWRFRRWRSSSACVRPLYHWEWDTRLYPGPQCMSPWDYMSRFRGIITNRRKKDK